MTNLLIPILSKDSNVEKSPEPLIVDIKTIIETRHKIGMIMR